MRVLPTMFHGILDYVVGLLTIALPFMLGLQGSQRAMLIILGAAVLLYSILTDYEFGFVRFLRIRFHLLLDALFGLAMLVLPWIMEFPPQARWPNYVIGVLALI